LQLAAGGVLVGLAAGYATRRLLRVLRWHGASAAQEAAFIQAMGYLTFYLANAQLQVSGGCHAGKAAAGCGCKAAAC
jgi:NhaP-type Na+/H+ or K+/H+ antiporter